MDKTALFLLFMCQLLFAQNDTIIKGVVKAENVSVEGIHVVNLVNEKTTITNAQGEFTLQLKATASSQIIVSFVGYSSKIVDTKGNTSLQIVLEEDNQQLNEVVVVGSRSAQNRPLTPAVTVTKVSMTSCTRSGTPD